MLHRRVARGDRSTFVNREACSRSFLGNRLTVLDPSSFVKAALVKGSLRTITAGPKYVDENEWVAVNRKLFTSFPSEPFYERERSRGLLSQVRL